MKKPDIVYLDEQVKSHFHSRAYPQEASFHSEYTALPPQSFPYTYLEKWNKLIGHCKEDVRVISVYEKCLEQYLYILSTWQVAAVRAVLSSGSSARPPLHYLSILPTQWSSNPAAHSTAYNNF